MDFYRESRDQDCPLLPHNQVVIGLADILAENRSTAERPHLATIEAHRGHEKQEALGNALQPQDSDSYPMGQ
jgi:hypothetical protein